jgi:hypothetical protein
MDSEQVNQLRAFFDLGEGIRTYQQILDLVPQYLLTLNSHQYAKSDISFDIQSHDIILKETRQASGSKIASQLDLAILQAEDTEKPNQLLIEEITENTTFLEQIVKVTNTFVNLIRTYIYFHATNQDTNIENPETNIDLRLHYMVSQITTTSVPFLTGLNYRLSSKYPSDYPDYTTLHTHKQISRNGLQFPLVDRKYSEPYLSALSFIVSLQMNRMGDIAKKFRFSIHTQREGTFLQLYPTIQADLVKINKLLQYPGSCLNVRDYVFIDPATKVTPIANPSEPTGLLNIKHLRVAVRDIFIPFANILDYYEESNSKSPTNRDAIALLIKSLFMRNFTKLLNSNYKLDIKDTIDTEGAWRPLKALPEYLEMMETALLSREGLPQLAFHRLTSAANIGSHEYSQLTILIKTYPDIISEKIKKMAKVTMNQFSQSIQPNIEIWFGLLLVLTDLSQSADLQESSMRLVVPLKETYEEIVRRIHGNKETFITLISSNPFFLRRTLCAICQAWESTHEQIQPHLAGVALSLALLTQAKTRSSYIFYLFTHDSMPTHAEAASALGRIVPIFRGINWNSEEGTRVKLGYKTLRNLESGTNCFRTEYSVKVIPGL